MSDFKQTQKQMKGPDEFQVKVMTWLDYLVKYKQIAIGAVAASFLLAAGAWGFKSFRENLAFKRGLKVTAVDMIYQEELETAAKSRSELQKQLDLANSGVDPAEPDPAKKALLEAKTKPIQDKMKAIKADHSKSQEQYKKVFEELKEYPEGWLAGLRHASFLAKDNKLDEARTLLAEILKLSKKNSFFQIHGGIVYVAVLEELKDYDTALTEVDSLIKVVPSDFKARTLLAKGRIQMAKKQSTEAQQTLDEVIKDFASSPEAEHARGMKAILN